MSIMAKAKCEGYVYGKIKGRLGSEPIQSAIVNIIGPEVKTIATDEAGKYEFPTITAGEYKIYAEAEGYEPSEEKQFKVEDGETHYESFLLRSRIGLKAKCEGYVYGKIEKKLGSVPIHRAIVNIIGPEVKAITTDKEGKYDSDIIAGDYKIYTEAEGYESSEEKQFKVEDGQTHSESFLLEETPQKKLKDWRTKGSTYSGGILWLVTYAVFGFAVVLAAASIFGFCMGTIELISVIGNSTETIKAIWVGGDGDEQVYVDLIKVAEHYLIAFTLLIIGIGLHRIVSKGFQIELPGIEMLESKMIGLVVVTLSVVFLSKLFGEGGITWEVGFSVSLIIIALGVFMFILKRKE